MTTYSPERIEEFRKMANTYWKAMLPKEVPAQIKKKTITGKELKLSNGGMASFMAGMAMQYNPKAIPEFTGIIQFNLDDERYHVLIKDEQCKAYEGEHPEPDLTIISPKQVWLDISSGKLNGTKAYMEGQYKTEGDMNLLMKFDQLFGSEKTQKDTSGPKEAPKDDNIPEHRGPITIPAMMWLTIAFIPWMIQWIGGSITPSPLPRYVAAAVAALISGYHLSTNIVTLFEAGTTLYFIVSAILTATGWGFFAEFGRVVDYLFLSGLWFGSVPRRFSLTAEYSRYLFPKIIWGKRSFKETNMIICTAWGGYFLVAALLNLIIISGAGSKIVWTIINYAILVPMFVFTSRFQKWYPDKLMRSA
jgi:putative sterol carrier protein